MKKISITLFALAGMAGAAFAGDTKAPAPAKAPDKAPAPKADAKADKAAPMPAPPAMAMPKPAPEIAEMAKSMSGTWKCEGTTAGMDMKTMVKMKGTMKSKSDLDGFWMHDTFEATAGTGKDAMKFKMEAFSTYDPAGKKWHNVNVMNDGGHMVGMSDGMKDGKMDVTSDTWSPMGAGQFKDHMDASDPKKGVHMNGEMSMDKGKTWMPVYDMVCKK